MAEKKTYAGGTPGWLKWIVLAFIAYAVYLHFTGEQVINKAPKEDGKAGLTQASRLGTTLPDITDTRIKVGGDIKGSGDEAQCGQTASVRVSASLPDGKEFNGAGTSAEAIDAMVGKSDDSRPWMAGLTGMSAGGVREVLVPIERVLDAKQMKEGDFKEKDAVRFRVHLDKLSPSADPDAVPLRVMDTLPGNGALAYCGDTVSVVLTFWGPDGKMLYDSGKEKPITLQLGESAVFYGLDRTILGMRAKGVRTAIVPPAYLVSDKENKVLDALPKGQLAIVDISLVSIEKPKQ